MNVQNFAAFFVLLVFIEFSFTVKPIAIKGKQGHLHGTKTERFYEVVC